jgi:hypothetical protein
MQDVNGIDAFLIAVSCYVGATALADDEPTAISSQGIA